MVNMMKTHEPDPDTEPSLPTRDSAGFQLPSWAAVYVRNRMEWNVQILPGTGPWNRTLRRGSRTDRPVEIKPVGQPRALMKHLACRALPCVKGQLGILSLGFKSLSQ